MRIDQSSCDSHRWRFPSASVGLVRSMLCWNHREDIQGRKLEGKDGWKASSTGPTSLRGEGGGGRGGGPVGWQSPPTLEFTTPLPSWPSSSLRLTSISCFNLSTHKVIKISDRLTETAHRNHETPRNIRFPCHHTPDAAGRTPLHQTQCLQIPQRRRTTDHGCNPRRCCPHWCRGRTRDARRRRFCRRRHRSRWISRRNRDARCKGDTTRRARTAKSRQLRGQRRIGRCFWTEGVQDTVPAPSATTPPPSPSKERLTCR